MGHRNLLATSFSNNYYVSAILDALLGFFLSLFFTLGGCHNANRWTICDTRIILYWNSCEPFPTAIASLVPIDKPHKRQSSGRPEKEGKLRSFVYL